jgi:3-phenylpropionate/trans-cinnamate dioxygenase ferredoxin reductase subunit
VRRASTVVVGAGVAGVWTAEQLRRAGYDGSVVLVGGEAHLPYDRPPLSKEYLTEPGAAAPLLAPEEHYKAQDIELELGVPVADLDLDRQRLTFADGRLLSYDDLVLATGSRARSLACVPPADNVFYLRSLDDATGLRSILQDRPRVVIAGGGFIGLEVAAASRCMGAEVTVVEGADAPLELVVGRHLGECVARLHEAHGVEVVTGETVERVIGDRLVTRVVTSAGRVLDCDALVVGVGAVPADELALAAGVPVEGGVLVDSCCRAGAPHVWAVGDVARLCHPVLGEAVRVEHWDTARRHAAVAAASITGRQEPCTRLPWFWSDQYDVNFQYVGYALRWDELLVRGAPDDMDFTALYLQGGRVRAALSAGRPRDVRAVERIIASGRLVERSVLADPSTDLRRLGRSGDD